MKLWALASGSSGNCYLLESEGTRLLVECGRPLRDVLRYLDHCGVHPSDLDGILLTHAHGDHSRSAHDLSEAHRLPMYASAGTFARIGLARSDLTRVLEAGQPVAIGDVEVHPFSVPHDCVEPLGFRFVSESGRACVATDLGWVPDATRAHFADLDLLVLEANYDPYLLHSGRYPAFLKARVSGYHGHLANEDAADAVAACGDRAPGRVWLAHISEHNNTPDHAIRAVRTALRQRGLGHVPVQATAHRRPSLRWDSAGTAEQLPLL